MIQGRNLFYFQEEKKYSSRNGTAFEKILTTSLMILPFSSLEGMFNSKVHLLISFRLL